jgi:serine protease AprX
MAATISPTLQQRMNAVANDEPIPVIVRRKEGTFSARVATRGGPLTTTEPSFTLFPGEAVKMTPADIEALSQADDVEYVWPDLPVHTCLNTSVPKINVPRVWTETGFKGRGIKVAVIDTASTIVTPILPGGCWL